MFLVLAGYMAYFNVSLADELKANPNNTKMEEQKQYVVRGSIYSADGEILAGTNVDSEGNETRIYPFGNVFAHTVGYTTNGKTGLEAIYNTDLLTSNTSIVEQVGKGVKNEKVRGDSLILTLDSRLQTVASTALGAYRGAVVVMEPSTGRVLAKVSKPDFDPNTMEEDWRYLTAEDSQSPLLDRAMQGLYPPGSCFKILTTLAYMRQYPSDYMNYTFDCGGVLTQGDMSIQCYDGEVHGYEDLQGSFQHSCNTSYANIGLMLDNDEFADLCEDFLFNSELPTVLPYSSSRFELNGKSSDGDVMTTAIGQGNTLVSPFHMALITCAVANDGRLMYPYMVERIENTEGVKVSETKPMQYKKLMTSEEASTIKSYMRSVVEGGTASSLWNDSYTVAGKTGSAEYEVVGNAEAEENFSTHSWFVGFSNVDDPDIVVSVIAEDGGTGSSAAVPIAKAIFDAYYSYNMG
ncbi:MAG: penicillin-binding transpeptidase domain-containing protein [Eubacteriales bacterium]|nr:penicillin-binding transpeptidase domain-containing protein [Eubacteriales bacterium]